MLGAAVIVDWDGSSPRRRGKLGVVLGQAALARLIPA